MKLMDALKNGEKKVAVVGLGYVGLPLALAFAEKLPGVIGFDINKAKLELYRQGIDPTEEAGDEAVKATRLVFTGNPEDLKEAGFIIVAVPTPVNGDKTPDLTPVIGASTLVGQNISRGAIVCFESTVYPGVTENICAPIIEKESGLKCGVDFKIAYSPERINPGDKVHRLVNITKIVSGMDEETLDTVAAVYELIIEAGVHRASSIKIAEAAKLVENAQRDINIAFMNELSMAFDIMNIDTNEVIEAMNTKWNALGFRPGLVGGHCIGVDPYYFIYEAEQLGYHSSIISAGRRVNDDMPKVVAEATIKRMIDAELKVKKAIVYMYGITFKENCPDVRNSKPLELCDQLLAAGLDVKLIDPVADTRGLPDKYKDLLIEEDRVAKADAIILAVAHKEFANWDLEKLKAKYGPYGTKKVFIDIKGMYNKQRRTMEDKGFLYWSL